MILYHAVTTYHLLECIAHRQTYYPNMTSYIMVSDFIAEKFPKYKDMEGKFFDKVILFHPSVFATIGTEQEIIEHAVRSYTNFFKDKGLNLDDFDKLFIAAPHFYIGFYLLDKNIRFTMMEEASGIASRPEILQEIEAKYSETKAQLCRNLGLYDGRNELIDHIICNFNAQIKNYIDKKAQHFDLLEVLSKMDQRLINDIVVFFGVYQMIDVPPHSTLLLTQHYANLKLMKIYEQRELYNLLVDYFIADESKLVIKPHPDDLMYYDKMFPRATIIREKFPSELIPFVSTERPDAVMTVTSTAIHNLKQYFNKTVEFSVEFEKNYHSIHHYYVVLDMIRVFGSSTIYAYQTDSVLLGNLARYAFPVNMDINHLDDLKNATSGGIIVIDDIVDTIAPKDLADFIIGLDNDTSVIFLNTMQRYVFYNYPDKALFNKLIPIEIIRKYEDDFGDQVQDRRTIYVYTNREELQSLAINYELSKNLHHSANEIYVKKLSKEEQRIRILEGVLEATEKRLEHYIKLEAELRSELMKYKKVGD